MSWITKLFSKQNKSLSLAELTRQQTKLIQKELDEQNERYAEKHLEIYIDKIYSYIYDASETGKFSTRIYLLSLFNEKYHLDNKQFHIVNKIRSLLKKEGFRVGDLDINSTYLFVCWE